MEHTQPGERAVIYDYQTGEEIRQATAKEEWRYIAQLLSMTGNQRTVGAVDGSDYDHDGTIYMVGGRVEIAAGIPDVDYDRAARLWSEFIGQQGTDEFMLNSRTDNIRDAVEDYIDSMPEDWQDAAPEDLADMLTAYIERDVRMAQLLRVRKMAERYNGYENYETWELCLELDNDQYLQSEAMRIAREAYLANGGEASDKGELIQPLDEDAIYGAAGDMKEWVYEILEELYPEIMGPKSDYNFLASTAIDVFLDEVNWEEVVEKFLEE